ncbi:TPR-like protein [Dentipellis sp. KUC8613]|nr:TPR-like protein [Dentipellis sp. KUC8613]
MLDTWWILSLYVCLGPIFIHCSAFLFRMSFLCSPILSCLQSIAALMPGCSRDESKARQGNANNEAALGVSVSQALPMVEGVKHIDDKTAAERSTAEDTQSSSALPSSEEAPVVGPSTTDGTALVEALRLEGKAQALCTQFERTGHLPDIDNAISALKQALVNIPDLHGSRPGFLSNLAYLYDLRFRRSYKLEDVNQSIAIREQLLDEATTDSSRRPEYLVGLGIVLCSRFQHSGQTVDIDRAISLERQAASLVPETSESYFRYLSNLGMALSIRFEHNGQSSDLDESISVQEKVVAIAPENYGKKHIYYSNFGGTLIRRFEQFGNIADINKAITMGERACSFVPDGLPVKSNYLNNLSGSFGVRYKRLGNLADLEQSIKAAETAIRLTPYLQPGLYPNLAVAYSSRFKRLGDPEDLAKSIEADKMALSLVPEGHASKPKCLNNLSMTLRNRFLQLGELPDIDAAISQEEKAIDLTPSDHSDCPLYLGNSADVLSHRFLLLNKEDDINLAITRAQSAVDMTPKEHPIRPDRLTNLANCYTRRFERVNTDVGIDNAVSAYREAVDLTPDDDRMKPGRLSNLAGSLLRRFQRARSPQEADLVSAISALQKTISLIQEDHAEMPLFLSNLGMALRLYYEHDNQAEHIEASIAKLEQSVLLTPDTLAAKSSYLNNLGDSYFSLFQHSNNNRTGSADKAIDAYRRSATSASGSPSLRFYAARQWSKMCLRRGSTPSLEAHAVVMSLVPRIVWLGSGISQRYDDVMTISDAVNEAAAAAIQLQDYTSALEWLEQGRAIVWGQMIHLRTPVDDLEATDPSLAKQLRDVSHQLERAGYPQSSGSAADAADRLSLQQEVDLHHKLAARWESLIETVRSLPGFENFLRPRTIAELSLAAQDGAIVVVNMHRSRCDALILRRTPDVQLQHVALPRMSYQLGQDMRSLMHQMLSSSNVRQGESKPVRAPVSDELLLSPELWSKVSGSALGEQSEPERGSRIASVGNMSVFERVLKILWLDLVKPVIDVLGYERNPDGALADTLPHVTWCGTGPMAFLPLHAAGIYDESNQARKVFEYVVSSYTPSITPLLAVRSPTKHPLPKGILAISQSHTPNKPALPGAIEELDAIKKLFDSSDVSYLEEKSATVASVINAMDERPWIHLACHGVQRADYPTKSGFCLEDGMLELSAIMEKSLQHAELAFLSACQTATGDEKRPDEGIHLAAGMLLAGYHSVLGTMWSIKDRDAPVVAGEVYRYLLRGDGKPDGRRAAYALHRAVARFRATLQNNEFVRWVPFIHVGSMYSLQYNISTSVR